MKTIVSLALLGAAAGCAEPLTLAQLVEMAGQKYPSVRVAEAEVRQAAAGIQLARTAYLPRVDAVAGVNRATYNNVAGLLLPSQILAPISGPVTGTNGVTSVWGTTVGVLATWEPFDFGLRAANVAAAEAGKRRLETGMAAARLQAELLAADSALTWLAAKQTAKAAQAGVDRAAEMERITEALVKAELRPGAESSLAQAETASAKMQVIRSRQSADEARAVLAVLIGSEAVEMLDGRLLSLPEVAQESPGVAGNPAVAAADGAIAESQAKLRALDRAYFPRFAVQGVSYARGTGAMPDGRMLGGANGLGPNVQNWGAGFTMTIPLLELPSIRSRKAAETAQLESERARREQVLLTLRMQRDKALAAYRAALELAQTTPAVSAAAKTGLEQVRARYRAGLGTALEVADAQRRLTQAEIDDSLARLHIWRARLAVYAAAGDLTPFLQEASR